MFTIHATKKLFAKLPLDDDGFVVAKNPLRHPHVSTLANGSLSHWHANLITLQRRNCVLLVHDATRFPLFIKCLVKDDFANFDWHFEDTLMNTLLKLGANEHQLEVAATLLGPCRFDTKCNRSVQGTMNQMKGDIEHMLWYDHANIEDISQYRVGVWMADRPCHVKGVRDCIWPQKEMLKLLSTRDATDTKRANMPENVVQFADYLKH